MIIAVRHPRPDIGEGICYGQRDIGLAEPVAGNVRGLMTGLIGRNLAAIVTSPLQRAHAYARALAQAFDLPLTVEPRLREMSFGTWEGVAWSEIARAEIDAWAADPLGYAPGGGESVAQLSARVSEVWQEANPGDGDQLWITHAGPMRCLAALSERADLRTCLERRFAYCEMLELAPPSR